MLFGWFVTGFFKPFYSLPSFGIVASNSCRVQFVILFFLQKQYESLSYIHHAKGLHNSVGWFGWHKPNFCYFFGFVKFKKELKYEIGNKHAGGMNN